MNDKRSGHGIYTYPNGDVYGGNWQDGMREDATGRGGYVIKTGVDDVEIDNWQKGNMEYASYRGCWKKNLPNGQGMMTFENKDRYEGEWMDGKMHGKGMYTWENGDRATGVFVEGEVKDWD